MLLVFPPGGVRSCDLGRSEGSEDQRAGCLQGKPQQAGMRGKAEAERCFQPPISRPPKGSGVKKLANDPDKLGWGFAIL